MKPIILFRSEGVDYEYELEIAKQYFPVVRYRSEIPKDSLVIPRYSCLPYFKELEFDVINTGSKLINSRFDHAWIANFDYYEDLKEFTFESWLEHEFPYSTYEGPFFVKGKTNSRKQRWKTHAYAPDRLTAIKIAQELSTDPLIASQGIIYRKFEKLKVFEYGITGMPYSNEHRCFFYKNKLLSTGYYWSIASNPELGIINKDGLELAHACAKIASEHVNFFVLDVAELEAGGWKLVEVNDGGMSGLSCNDASVLYKNLLKAVGD